jgi:hypothetical protein
VDEFTLETLNIGTESVHHLPTYIHKCVLTWTRAYTLMYTWVSPF